MVLEWVLIIAAVALCVILVAYGIRKQPSPFPYGGLLWFRQGRTFWGPCCLDCQIQYFPRRIFDTSDGQTYYELVCPVCAKTLAGQAFSLEALLILEKDLADSLRLRRVGEPLTAALKVFQGAPQ